MAKKEKKKGKKKGKTRSKGRWESLVEEYERRGNAVGDAFYLQEGKTRLKLVPADEDDEESFFCDVTRWFRGDAKSKVMVRAWVIGEEEDKIRGVVCPKSVMKGIFQLLAEGYDLLGNPSTAVVIAATGQNLDRSYTVMPSRKEIELPDDIENDDLDIEDVAKQVEQSDLDRDKEAQKGKGKKGKKGSKKRAKQESDEDEDDDEDDEDEW